MAAATQPASSRGEAPGGSGARRVLVAACLLLGQQPHAAAQTPGLTAADPHCAWSPDTCADPPAVKMGSDYAHSSAATCRMSGAMEHKPTTYCWGSAPDCATELPSACATTRASGTAECTACVAAAIAQSGCRWREEATLVLPEVLEADFCAPGLSPLRRTLLTAYHVNPSDYGVDPINMNLGDGLGDLVFSLSSLWLSVECSGDSSGGGVVNMQQFDCQNPEKVDPDLRVTKVVLEIDTRTGPYQACNICVDGKDPMSNVMAGGAAASSGDDDGKPCSTADVALLGQMVHDCGQDQSDPSYGPCAAGVMAMHPIQAYSLTTNCSPCLSANPDPDKMFEVCAGPGGMMAMIAAMTGGGAPKTCAMEPVPEYICGCQSSMMGAGAGSCDDTVVGVESVSATFQPFKPGTMFPGAQHTPAASCAPLLYLTPLFPPTAFDHDAILGSSNTGCASNRGCVHTSSDRRRCVLI